MGNNFSYNRRIEEDLKKAATKRPWVEEDEAVIAAKRRKRSKSTSQYIYEALFVSGEGSDVIVRAFEREWRLHKVYLKQAHFFSKMFDGKWKETNDKVRMYFSF